ncbi:MAG TPA: DUF2306 domain-containing protein [Bacteroidetes bacterium]|nr:DUF2306 domain-containing protein [Bacteroidota bacterium]
MSTDTFSSSFMQKFIFRFGWALMTFFAIFLAGMTISYFSFRSDINFLLKKQDVVFNLSWRTAFYIHISGGLLALLTGPFQFIKKFRTKYMKFHRILGKVYLAAILFLGAPAGLFMGFYAEGGLISVIGFMLMGLLWIGSTYFAYEAIRKREIEAHRAWMVRSFALTFAAVTLRLYVPLATAGLNWDADFVITSSAWVSWVPNLLIAEVLLRTIKKKL